MTMYIVSGDFRGKCFAKRMDGGTTWTENRSEADKFTADETAGIITGAPKIITGLSVERAL